MCLISPISLNVSYPASGLAEIRQGGTVDARRRRPQVCLDKVIKNMKETGADMKVKNKETAHGGLAVSVIEC